MWAALAAGPLAAQAPPLRPGGLLVEPATTRAEALAGAGVAVVGDEGSVFVNPAGMAPIRRTTLGGSAALGPGDTRFAAAAAVLRIGRFDFGVGAMARDWGDTITITAPGPGTIAAEDLQSWAGLGAVAAAYRRGLLSVGATAKALREHVADSAGEYWDAVAVTGDVGLAVTVFDIMALGAVMQNLAGTFVEDSVGALALPRTIRVGYALNMIDPQGEMRLLLTTEWIRPQGGDSWWALGAEGGMVRSGVGAVVRAGYAAGRAGADRRAPSFGAGLVLGPLRVDYAWQGWNGGARTSHRIGARWAL